MCHCTKGSFQAQLLTCDRVSISVFWLWRVSWSGPFLDGFPSWTQKGSWERCLWEKCLFSGDFQMGPKDLCPLMSE